MPGGSPQPHFQWAARQFLPNLGINILVTQSRIARAVLNLWRRIPGNNLPEKVRLVGTLAEAHEMIEKHNAESLPVA
jgi:hypothetical protein